MIFFILVKISVRFLTHVNVDRTDDHLMTRVNDSMDNCEWRGGPHDACTRLIFLFCGDIRANIYIVQKYLLSCCPLLDKFQLIVHISITHRFLLKKKNEKKKKQAICKKLRTTRFKFTQILIKLNNSDYT